MRILVFDTETTGLPKSKIISPDTLNLWPHIVQFSYIIYDTDIMNIVEMFDYIIKMDDNIIIPPETIAFHSITNEISKTQGVCIEGILEEFYKYLQTVDAIVGHNISFDIDMVKIELLRCIYLKNITKNEIKLFKKSLHFITNYKNIFCTMKENIDFCSISTLDKKGQPYLKFPKLIELHKKIFGTEPNNLHNSLNDIIVTLRCFIKIKLDKDIFENNSYNDIYVKIFK